MEIKKIIFHIIKTPLVVAFLMGLFFFMAKGYAMHAIPLPPLVGAILYTAIAVSLIVRLEIDHIGILKVNILIKEKNLC